MIETFDDPLGTASTLSCRAAGRSGAPVLVFLHGFPEAAFVWDELLEHFSDRYRCVAPNLRGYERSSAPAEVEAYRAKHLVGRHRRADRRARRPARRAGRARLGRRARLGPGRAAARGDAKRLVIINSPHPATFLRELRDSPAQQAASAYMNFLCRPDAEALLQRERLRAPVAVLHQHGRGRSGARRRRLADRDGARPLSRGLARRACAAAATTTAPRRCGRRAAPTTRCMKVELAPTTP